MDNENMTPEQRKAERQRALRFQRNIRMAAILLAIVLSIISLVQSCATQKAIEDLAAQIAAKKAAQAQTETVASPSPAQANDGGITLSFIGDCILTSPLGTLGAGTFQEYYDNYGESYFFQNVRSIFTADDLTVGYLACSFTTADLQVEAEKAYRADPAYAAILADGGIDALCVSGGGSMDFGEEGYVDTLANLDNNGLARFGGDYTTIVTADGVPVGLTAVNAEGEGYQERLLGNIESLREEGAELVIAQFYWGDMTDSTLAGEQSAARAAIDAGADAVVGYGTQEGIELYNGKYICYGLEDFLTAEKSAGDTFILQLTFPRTGTETAEMTIIPCSTSTDPTVNNFCPTVLGTEEGQSVIDGIYDRSAVLPGGITREADATADAQ